MAFAVSPQAHHVQVIVAGVVQIPVKEDKKLGG
jgi:hypothetical protein